MKFNNVHDIFSTKLTNIHKCLEKTLFTRRTESLFLSEFFLIHFGGKKVYFLSICQCWSNWWKKFGVHCRTSCKIRTPTDKYCGNGSKIRLTSKNPPFYTPIFTFQINDQKTREFRQPSDISRGHFFRFKLGKAVSPEICHKYFYRTDSKKYHQKVTK
jgi:hypothetical protein